MVTDVQGAVMFDRVGFPSPAFAFLFHPQFFISLLFFLSFPYPSFLHRGSTENIIN